MIKLKSGPLSDTEKIAEKFSGMLKPGDIIAVTGSLGAGKTAFIKYVASNLGVQPDQVTSSSFVVMQEYKAKVPVCHVDLYRLDKNQVPDEVFEYMERGYGITLIEWADKLNIDTEHFKVFIELVSLKRRQFCLTATNNALRKRLRNSI